MTETIIKNSMEIILHAGDARLHINNALDFTNVFDIESAKQELALAEKLLSKAHKVQTDSIQCEMSGEALDYSLLFAHAQDTLMTIYSELNLTKKLIAFSNSINERLSALEGKNA